MNRKLYQHIASRLEAVKNCQLSGNTEWEGRHRETIKNLIREYLPSGSGIDNGVSLYDNSHSEKLVFALSYHHMNEAGYYDGWTEHTIVVTPSLSSGFNLKITGRDRNQIKDYLGELFQVALSADIDDAVQGIAA